jgi:MFS family permease
MLFGMDTGIISGVLTMPGFKKYVLPSLLSTIYSNYQHRTYQLENIDKVAAANLSANIVSTLQAGCFFGAMGASPVAERYGRRMALLGSAVVAVLGILMQTAASGHIEVMYIGRYIYPHLQSIPD